MPHEFDRQIEVRRTGDGGYAAELSPGWSVGGGVNGGYLLAIMANALRDRLPDKPDPLVVSAYYLSASTPGAATVDVDVRREGGSVATASLDLRQGDDVRITALATYGDLGTLGDDVRTTAEEPDMPPVEDCVPNSVAPPEVRAFAPLMDRFDMRFHPDHIGWAVGEPSGNGVLSAWFRLVDGREPDPISLLMVVDALPPVTFDLGDAGLGADARAHGARARAPGPGLAEGAARDPQHGGRDVRGGLRGLGLRGPAGGPEPPARAPAPALIITAGPRGARDPATPIGHRHGPQVLGRMGGLHGVPSVRVR